MLAFIHIHKTAGSTVRYILRSSYGTAHCDVEPWHARFTEACFSVDDLQRLGVCYPVLRSIAGHRVTGYVDLAQGCEHMQYFTFMRDPVRTLASHYQFNVETRGMKHLDFEQWLGDEWTHNRHTKMIAGSDNVEEAIRLIGDKEIFVGLTERFDESMLLLKRLVAPDLNISYQPVNTSRTRTLASELVSNPRTRQMLVEANLADLALYDYVREHVYPAYRRSYGGSLASDVERLKLSSGGFNQWNLNMSRLKRYLLYKPMLYVYRRRQALIGRRLDDSTSGC